MSWVVAPGNVPRTKIVSTAVSLVAWSRSTSFRGDPRRDWLSVRTRIRQAGEPNFVRLAAALEYLVAFARGVRISAEI